MIKHRKGVHIPKFLLPITRTRDHLHPASLGGRGTHNMVFACHSCNVAKGNKPLNEFGLWVEENETDILKKELMLKNIIVAIEYLQKLGIFRSPHIKKNKQDAMKAYYFKHWSLLGWSKTEEEDCQDRLPPPRTEEEDYKRKAR